MAGQPYNISCEASGASPPAQIEWRIPDGVSVVHQDQSDIIQGNVYISQKAVTITPSKNDQGKILNCIASHSELHFKLQCLVNLSVHVFPKSVLLFPTGGNQSQSTVLYVQEDSPTSITCKSIGSFPATDLSWTFFGNNESIPINANISKTRSVVTIDNLVDTESTIAIRPEMRDHRIYIQCYVSLNGFFVEILTVQLIVYGPPDDVIMSPLDAHDGMETNVTCRAVNGYPTPLIHWYIGSRNLTDNSLLKSSLNDADRYDAESTLTFTPKRLDHGKRLLCQAVQPETPFGRSMNDSMVLNISYVPMVSITSRWLAVNTDFPGFVLKCTSDANPPATTFHWFCNGTKLLGHPYTMLSDTVVMVDGETVTSSEFAIGNPRSADPCGYKCIAVSAYGSGYTVFNSTFYEPQAKVKRHNDGVPFKLAFRGGARVFW